MNYFFIPLEEKKKNMASAQKLQNKKEGMASIELLVITFGPS